jgi:small conductance mechanosensitive channel
MRSRAQIVISLLGSIHLVGFAFAQAPPEVEKPSAPAAGSTSIDDVSTKALEELKSTIEDPERRAKLVEQINALVTLRRSEAEKAAPKEEEGLAGGVVGFFGNLSAQVRNSAVQLVTEVLKLPEKAKALWERLSVDPEARKRFVFGAAACVGIVLGSIAAAVVCWIPVRRLRARFFQKPPPTRLRFLVRLLRLLAVAVLEVIPQVALVGSAMGAVAAIGPPKEAAAITLAVVWALAAKQLADAAIELLFAPRAASLRLISVGDERAAALAASLSHIAAIGVYGFFALEALRNIGTEDLLLAPLRSLYGLVLLASGIALVLREREHVRAYLLARTSRAPPAPEAPPEPEAAGAASWRSAMVSALGLWWLAAITYMVGLYTAWVSGAEGVFGFVLGATLKTLLAIAGAAALIGLLRRLVDRLQNRGSLLAVHFPDVQPYIRKYVRGVAVVLYSAVFAVAACVGLEAWGISVLSTLGSRAAQDVVAALIGILIVVLLAAATIDVATVFTQRQLEARERSGKATAKLRTLLPLSRKAIRAVVMVVAAIMVLSQAGVNVGPILAGVGVLGLAIGFGAQTLVKDIITGVFILLEDTVAVGDVVTLRSTTGVVEAINLRTLKLRDGTGFVHTIPYSSVETVTNMSRDFGRCVIEASVGYNEDVDEVMALLREIDEGLRRDPAYSRDILEPIDVQGLERFEDSAVVVRATLKTTAGQRARIGREFNRRMKKLFDERGVEIPFPCQTLYIAETKDGGPSRAGALLRGELAPSAEGKEMAGDVRLDR